MSKVHISCCALLLSLAVLFTTGHSDIGTATVAGGPPYIPNACDFGESQFPSSYMFASAGEAIWDNGAACGRRYQVRCTSAASPGACIFQTVEVTIVDRALTLASQPLRDGCTLVLPKPAFHKIATEGTESINLEFIPYSN